ncbi:MAG: (Fe-S)-binding protein [Deltaproteobacteria bacterium]
MISGILVMGGLGVAIGLCLALASKVFYVYVDPKIEAVDEALPGANCGGCGFPGCSSNAAAIVAGESSPGSCVAGGPDVAAEIAAIMGVEVELREPEIATPGCRYGTQEADLKYVYQGVHDCRAAMLLGGGAKVCPIGCLGLGTCVRACPFDALSIGPDNLPVVNVDRCTGCGTCERVCPKHIITLSSNSIRIIDEYQTDECTAPCQRNCPTGINIPKYISQIDKGNYAEALLTIKEKCPLPLICGHICPAPCELACRRNLVDEPVAINPLKRFVSEYEMTTGTHINPYKAADNHRKIAVIGGGAEGLTAGYYLARLGYQPTLFEAKPQLGGILRYVIAEDRLPREILDHEIEGILNMGVEAKTGMLMGEDFTPDSLIREGYQAIVLTSGGIDSRKILRPEAKGFDLPFKGFFILLDLWEALSRNETVDIGQEVALVHNMAEGLDLARSLRAQGAKTVHIISNLDLNELPTSFKDTRALSAEGIAVHASTTVTSLKGVNDQLKAIELETRDPRRPDTTEQSTLPVDTLVFPGARLPELVFVLDEGEETSDADITKWRTLETFHTFPKTDQNGVFSAPEPGRLSDSSAVVKSILSGRRLCRAIHSHFAEGQVPSTDDLVCEADWVLDVSEVHSVKPVERERPPALDVEGDSESAWIFPKPWPGLDEAGAKKEASRCLSCGLICYKKSELE